STSNTFFPSNASEAPKLIVVVVLPTPPFWFATAIILPIILLHRTCVIATLIFLYLLFQFPFYNGFLFGVPACLGYFFGVFFTLSTKIILRSPAFSGSSKVSIVFKRPPNVLTAFF